MSDKKKENMPNKKSFKEKVGNTFDKYIMPVMIGFSQQRHLAAIRDGLSVMIIPIVIGSLFLILAFLPIPGWSWLLSHIFGPHWQMKAQYPISVTMGLLGLIASLTVAYQLANFYKVDNLAASFISLTCFLLLTPFQNFSVINHATKAASTINAIPTQYLGSSGLFVAILVAIGSTELFRFLTQKNWTIKMPKGVPPAVARSFAALLPAALCIIGTFIIRLLIELTPFSSIHEIINTYLALPLVGFTATLGGYMLYIFLVHFFWFFGIHGYNVLLGVYQPLLLTLMDQNRVAYEAGHALPHIFTLQFQDVYVNLGGAGATLPLVILMLFFAKSKQLRAVGRIGIAPGIFAINEPVLFGLPIVLNPILFLPFIITPLILVLIAYFAIKIGLVPGLVGVALPWTTPPFFNSFLASGGRWQGIILQIVELGASFLIYYPFFRFLDKQQHKNEILLAKKEQELKKT